MLSKIGLVVYCVLCVNLSLLCIYGQSRSLQLTRGISLVVPGDWELVERPDTLFGLGTQKGIEILATFKKTGKYDFSPSVQVTFVREHWSLEEMGAEAGAETLESYKSAGISISDISAEVEQIGNNKGHLLQFRAKYPGKSMMVKHAMFSIPGPGKWTVMISAVSDEREFEQLKSDWRSILEHVSIDWSQVGNAAPPRRGVGTGALLGLLLGSLYWLFIRKWKQRRS